jgi:hypothetical protein
LFRHFSAACGSRALIPADAKARCANFSAPCEAALWYGIAGSFSASSEAVLFNPWHSACARIFLSGRKSPNAREFR